MKSTERLAGCCAKARAAARPAAVTDALSSAPACTLSPSSVVRTPFASVCEL